MDPARIVIYALLFLTVLFGIVALVLAMVAPMLDEKYRNDRVKGSRSPEDS